MDAKELEEKLERDNLTLKEHIMKLQNTIKQIKTDIVQNTGNEIDHKQNLMTGTGGVKNTHNIKNQNIFIKKNDKFDKNEKIDDQHMKFSFNNSEKNTKLNSASHNVFQEESFKYEAIEKKNKIKKNVYHENLDKLRKEKEIIQQMEHVKKKANMKKTFNNDELDENEVDQFHRNYNIHKKTINREQSDDDLKEDNSPSHFYHKNLPVFNNNYYNSKTNNMNIDDLHLQSNYPKQSFRHANYQESESESNSDFKHYTIDQNSSIKKNNISNFSNLSNRGKNDKSFNDLNDANNLNEEEDSFEKKIKNLQNIKKSDNNIKLTNNKTNSINSASSVKFNKKTEPIIIQNKNTKTLPKSKSSNRIISACKTIIIASTGLTGKTNKDNNVNKTKETIQNQSRIEDKDKNELLKLRKDIKQLTLDNQKLKQELQKEKEQNIKVKSFAEELVKFYSGYNNF